MLRDRKRTLVYAGLFVMMAISYLDRINLSVAARPLARSFGLDAVATGYLLSAYLWTYLILLVPLGVLVDRWGARRVTAGSMALWSVGGALTGLATGFGTAVASRLVLGAGEAASYPVGGRVVREWAPASERGLAAAWLNGGAYAGPAVGALAVGWIVAEAGWRASFVVTGVIGLFGAVVWYLLYRSPEDARWLGADERAFILERRADAAPAGGETARAALSALLRSPTMWGLALAQGCAGYTLYLFMSWLPTYLATSRDLDVATSGAFTAVPYAVAAVLGLLLGRASDRFLTPQRRERGGRRTLIAVCLLCSAVILLAPLVTTTWLLLLLFSVSLTCVSTAMGMNIALTNDLLADGRRTGVATSVLIFGGNSFGAAAPIVTGYAVQATGSFATAFGIAGALLLAGTAVVLGLTRRPLGTAAPAAAGDGIRAVDTPTGTGR